MAVWRVSGTVVLGVDMRVEAESAEMAIERAHEQWPGMSNWVGNGKHGGAMCGPHQDETDANVDCDYGDPSFDRAEQEDF